MGFTYDFTNQTDYSVTVFNKLRRSLVYPGVIPDSPNSCKVIRDATQGNLRIMPGTAILPDGGSMTITSAGYDVQYVIGKTNYIFLFLDTDAIYKVAAATAAPPQEALLLARMTYDDILIDTRTFCRSRAPSYEYTDSRIYETNVRALSKNTIYTYDVELCEDANFFVIVPPREYVLSGDTATQEDYLNFIGYYNSITDKTYSYLRGVSDGIILDCVQICFDLTRVTAGLISLTFEKEGNILHIFTERADSSSSPQVNYVPIKIIAVK